MNEEEMAREMLPFALTVARQLSQDPEDASMAGLMLVKALRTWNMFRGPLHKHVARCVKMGIYHRWRKMRVRSVVRHTEDMTFAASYDDPPDELELTDTQWRILTEKFVLKWPYDVVAKRNGMNTSQCKRYIAALVSRLEHRNDGS